MSINDATPEQWDKASHSAALLSYKNMAEKEASKIDEMVEEPPHYNMGSIQCIDAKDA